MPGAGCSKRTHVLALLVSKHWLNKSPGPTVSVFGPSSRSLCWPGRLGRWHSQCCELSGSVREAAPEMSVRSWMQQRLLGDLCRITERIVGKSCRRFGGRSAKPLKRKLQRRGPAFQAREISGLHTVGKSLTSWVSLAQCAPQVTARPSRSTHHCCPSRVLPLKSMSSMLGKPGVCSR